MSSRGEILWEPRPDAASATRMGRFATGLGCATYAELLALSVNEPEDFWARVVDELGVVFRERGSQVLADPVMPGARWFPGATLNHVDTVRARAVGRGDEPAVLARSQTRGPQVLSWDELLDQVQRCATGLRRLGVGPGDRVAGYVPNIAEAVVAFLASASLGAIWSSCAPEFGVRAVLDRFSQIEPTVLIGIDGYVYGSRTVDRRDELAQITAGLPSLTETVTISYLGTGPDTWSDLLAESEPIEALAVPFDHPLYVLYSSGTTGLPKAIVHGHGGITVEHVKSLALHHDLGPGSRFTWFTTTGWMMWNYLVSGLAVGATLVLFDGDPGHPDLTTLWNLAAETGCEVFGASAPFLMACRSAGIRPEAPSVTQVGSTGAPLPAEGFRWVSEVLGPHVQLASISGGTDVCTAFVGMNPLTPVRAGEISGAVLGCAVAALGPDGEPCPPGVQGELVITRPMPSMPVGFWGDEDGSRYGAAYFEDFPGRWRHGDWVTFTDDGACVISGRSDSTLNRGGVRVGTADLYAVVEDDPAVADSLVVHLEGADQLVLFVVPAGEWGDDDVARLRVAVRSELSPRHVPDVIELVPSVPRTLSGKKLEVPVKRILSGADPDQVASRGSLADPRSLDHFVERARTEEMS